MHHGAIFPDRPPDDALQPRQRKIVRNVPNFLDTRGFEPAPSRRSEPRQLVDAVLGNDHVPCAMFVVRAQVWSEAVPARRDLRWRWLGEHALHRPHLQADGIEMRGRLVKPRMHREQGVEIEPHAVVDVVSVEGEHRGLAHIEPGTAKNPELDGQVEQEDLLEPSGRLDLDQTPRAPGKALDHVGADQHPFVLEGGFEHRGRGVRLDDLTRLLQRLRNVQVIVSDPFDMPFDDACPLDE